MEVEHLLQNMAFLSQKRGQSATKEVRTNISKFAHLPSPALGAIPRKQSSQANLVQRVVGPFTTAMPADNHSKE